MDAVLTEQLMSNDSANQGIPARWRHWMVSAHVLILMAGLCLVEWGMVVVADAPGSRSQIDAAMVWMMQSLVTGIITLLLLAAWLNVLCISKWPSDVSFRENLILIVAWSCAGWIFWILTRTSTLGQGDLIVPFLMLALPTLCLTVPLLWHATRRVQHPGRAAVFLGGFVMFAALSHYVSVKQAAHDPAFIWIANSALIVAAIVVWLVILNTTSSRRGTREAS